MSRLTYAAEQLRDQLMLVNPDAIMATADDADGVGVHRTVSFDKDSSTYLSPLLAVIAPSDPRIVSTSDAGGILNVTFSAGINADDRTPYPLDEVAAVLAEAKPEEKPAPKKK